MAGFYKKILAVSLTVIVAAFAFAGCSDNSKNDVSTTRTITTDAAVIKDADAINLIKTYSAAELGLEGSVDDYSIMVGGSGEKIDGKYYIKVIASKVSEPDAEGRVTVDTYGQYFINYNGTEILIYNEADDTYTPMAEVHSVPETAAENHSHTENE